MTQKGVSLYYVVVITSLLLGITLGLSAILVGQIKALKEMGNSVLAFFGADTGMEYILYLDKKCYELGCSNPPCRPDCQGLPVGYTASGVVSTNGADYVISQPRCHSFQSRGKFMGITRAVESSRFSYKFAFATQVPDGNLGGVSGADTTCQNAAAVAGLAGTYKAWISSTDSATQPSTRFTTASVSYIRTDCVIIANDWTDLTDGTILAPINKDAGGGSIADDSHVFTNTNPDGTATITDSQPNVCWNWTSGAFNRDATYGIISSSELGGGRWTTTGLQDDCDTTTNYIYCFQQ